MSVDRVSLSALSLCIKPTYSDFLIKADLSIPSRNTSKITLKYISLPCSLWESF